MKPTNKTQRKTSFWSSIGPGLIMAGAAIGVSHLVQSTRAGAEYGWQLLGLVLLIHFFKYPFFEFGHRYAAATGENLLQGYRKLGKGWLLLFLLLSLGSCFITVAAVTFVTASLGTFLLQGAISASHLSIIILAVCFIVLAIGHYQALDSVMKGMMVLLLLGTLAAFLGAAFQGPQGNPDITLASPWSLASLPFLIAFMGWMPAPVEISVWQSLWIQAKNRSGQNMDSASARLDFNLGYFLTLFLAILFLLLGWLVIAQTGQEIPDAATAFSALVVSLYTESLGQWARPIIAIAAFFTMLSTTLSVFDAYPRSLAVGLKIALPSLPGKERLWHLGFMLASIAGTWAIVESFLGSLKALVDFATILAFLSSPLFAILNTRLLLSSHMPEFARPGKVWKFWCYAGILWFSLFALVFIWATFIR